MSRDIRSFFSSAGSKSRNDETREINKFETDRIATQSFHRKRRVVHSDDEDATIHSEKSVKKKKSSDSIALTTVDISRVFSESPVKQKQVMKSRNKIDDIDKKKIDEEDTFQDIGIRKNFRLDLRDHYTDEERYDKKKAAAMLYHKFKNRSGPTNPGTKEVPKGKSDCLVGYTFLITGTLDSMDREEASTVIQDHGGRVVKSISKKLSFLIYGEDAGPAKLAKAEEFGIPKITEDELLDLIREKSGLETISSQLKNTEVNQTSIKGKIQSSLASSSTRKSLLKRTNESCVSSKLLVDHARETLIIPTLLIVPSIVDTDGKAVFVDDDKNKTNLSWVDKYKPVTLKQIIGQQGANTNSTKLYNWLNKWDSVHDGRNHVPKPNIWAKNDDGIFFKAALLSGPPGVGKTTTATLVCNQLGYDIVEFNASDTRSKKLLNDEVSTLLSNHALSYHMKGSIRVVSKRRVLIMDEVDGMAGNEDRGGISELIKLIKNTQVPVICLCNDRNHQKIRSLVQHCFDLRFTKPKLEQIRGAMMSICFKEGIKISPKTMDGIIINASNDIRQTLNYLALYAISNGQTENNKDIKVEFVQKDIKIGPWEVIRKVFSVEEHKHMSINEKSSLFFYDYSLGPLFVHENYICVTPEAPKRNHLLLIALTADSLSMGDVVETCIRSSNAWSLLPTQAILSSVLPGHYMKGNISKQINFPGWLGKHSTNTKRKRLAKEIHNHTRSCISGSRLSLRIDYASFLLKTITNPLRQMKLDGVSISLDIIKKYGLLREDLESLSELTTWPKQKTLFDGIESKVKAALTRLYNKDVKPYAYSHSAAIKQTKVSEIYYDMADEPLSGSEPENDDNIENNRFIKVRKTPCVLLNVKLMSKKKK